MLGHRTLTEPLDVGKTLGAALPAHLRWWNKLILGQLVLARTVRGSSFHPGMLISFYFPSTELLGSGGCRTKTHPFTVLSLQLRITCICVKTPA